MKVSIKRNSEAKLGYELVIAHDDGMLEVKEITQTDPANPNILKLPENPSNRKWLSVKKIVDDELELTYKATMVFGPRGNTSPKKDLSEYLEGKDKELYLQLVEKAKKNREEMHKKAPLTEKEKLERRLAKLQEELKKYE